MTVQRHKRFAILSPGIPPDNLGGIAIAHYNLFRAFRRHNYDAKIFSFQDPCPHRVDLPDVIRAGVSASYVRVADAMVWLWLKLMRARGLCYNLTDIFAHSAGACKLRGPLREFNPDVVILPDQGSPGFFLKKFPGVRFVLISHHNPMRFVDEPRAGNFSRVDAEWAVAVENRVLKQVDLVICPSHYMRDVFLATYQYAGPVSVIPNLLDGEKLDVITPDDIRLSLGLGPNAPLIYIPSAGNPFKGAGLVYDLLRDLAERHPEPVGVYLSGTIPPDLAVQLKNLPATLQLYTPGRLPHEQNLAIVKSCTFGISPTLVENFGMALLEATHCNIPMITFDVGGNREIIQDDRNGIVVPSTDVYALVECAARLLSTPESLNRLRAGCSEIKNDEKHIFNCYIEAMESVRG